jgi:predicted GNAT family N-acyltransferase
MVTTAWFFGGHGLSDAHAIRRRVFIEEQNIAEDVEMDGTDASCIHLVVYDEAEAPVATGRIHIYDGEFSIGRVAVLPGHRGKRYGLFVMQVLIHACYTMGGERQVVRAQVPVRGFYEKLGFTAFGEVFEEAGIPHISMERYGDTVKLCREM